MQNRHSSAAVSLRRNAARLLSLSIPIIPIIIVQQAGAKKSGTRFFMCRCILERATRIELATSAWEADVLPLNYARITVARMIQKWSWKRDLNTRPAHYECAALPTELFQHRILLCGIRHSTYILYHKFLLCQEVSKKFSEKSKKRLKSKKRCVIMIGYCKKGALRARVP